MKIATTSVLVMAACASVASADITFTFLETGGNVTMNSSGTFDTTGLPVVGPFGWGSTGLEENGNHDIMGGTDVGAIDISFAFNAGTDYSQWASANGPWTTSSFPWTVNAVKKGFATYVRYPNTNAQVPGLGVEQADLNGALWTPDQSWTWFGGTFASLGMNVGIYTVSDAVTGESITFHIVPAPASLALLGLSGLAIRRRR
ncbi:MAG: hypothetical protein ACF8NJ_02600 [Phycisphaerales bacterium JB038]